MEELTFGIEIEYRDLLRNTVQKYLDKYYSNWKNEIERAISKDTMNPNLGGEVISPPLVNESSAWEAITNICNFLNKNKASSINTGAHIHIGAKIFENNSLYLFRFIKLWCAFEPIIYRFSYGEYIYARPTLFEYSKPVAKEFKFLIDTLNLSSQNNFNYLVKVLNLGKKRGLNLSNINQNFQKNTIEFRTPNGTLNPNIWYNNFIFFLRLIEYAKNSSYNEDIVNIYLKQELNPFDNQILFSQAYNLCELIYEDKREKLEFMNQYLKGYEQTKEYKLARTNC